MAHYYKSSYYLRRNLRKWIYGLLPLLIIAVTYGVYKIGSPWSQRSSRGGVPEVAQVVSLAKPATERPSSPPVQVQAEAPQVPPPADNTSVAPRPDPEAERLIAEAMACLEGARPRVIEARDRLNETLSMSLTPAQTAQVKSSLAGLADQWLFSRNVFEGDRLCGHYRVQPGDMLLTIAARYKVPYEILMSINGINRPEALRASDTIKVIEGPFHVRVYRSTFTMDLYLQDRFIRSFKVGLGRGGMETPTGLWRVKPGGKLIAPKWTDPDTGRIYEPSDPDYPLGSRWIGLEGVSGDAEGRIGFAIHGTKDPDQIGTAGSRGCIRMHNGDATLIYGLLSPRLSQIDVVE